MEASKTSELNENITAQWGKVGLQFRKTSQFVNEVIKGTQDLEQLRKSAKELQEAVENLNYVLSESASCSSTGSKNKRSLSQGSTASASKKKRQRKNSGLIGLEELTSSLQPPEANPTVLELQGCTSIKDKIKLLYNWELQGNRLQIRASFHQGYYLAILLRDYKSINQLCKSLPDIPDHNIKRNLQLFEQLGKFRTILNSTLPVYKLWQSITQLKKQLNCLSPEERNFWTEPKTDDASCFISCFKKYHGNDPSLNVYYILDIYDNNLSNLTNNALIEQLCTIVKRFVSPEVDDLTLTQACANLPAQTYMLWFKVADSEIAHCTLIHKKEDGKWWSEDESHPDYATIYNAKWEYANICIINKGTSV